MKTTYLTLLFCIGLTACGFTSCASTSPQPPPSSLDKTLFDIQTAVTHQTNVVNQTNVVTVTNTDHQVIMQTNVVESLHDVYVTNYTYTPKSSITDTVNSVAPIAGPWGTMAATALSGALGLFAFFKNRQANTMTQVAGSTAIALDTAQKVMATIPTSAAQAATASFNTWLASHQNDVDIAHKIAMITDDFIDPTHNTTVAAGIVAQATKPITPSGSTILGG